MMPPPRQYPGLGPLPEALGMAVPYGGVGPGTREQGLELLRQLLIPPSGEDVAKRERYERFMGPVKRAIQEYTMPSTVPPRVTTPEQKMAEQRGEMERAYYSVPAQSEEPFATMDELAERRRYQRSEVPLGPSASGRAVPTPSDIGMIEKMPTVLGAGILGKIPMQWFTTATSVKHALPQLEAERLRDEVRRNLFAREPEYTMGRPPEMSETMRFPMPLLQQGEQPWWNPTPELPFVFR